MNYKIKTPVAVDYKDFGEEFNESKILYGLPKEVTFCSTCLMSNQKPNSVPEFQHTKDTVKETMVVDKDKKCAACKAVEKKKEIPWDEREKELIDLCNKYRSEDGSYDCLVPGSGGKDSFYASHVLKYKYGMHPLTVTWSPHLYTDWGWKNFQAWISDGHDNFLFSPNRKVERLLTRLSIERIFHPFQPFIMGQMYFPPKLAARLGIELIFYGENPSEYGNAIKSNDDAKKDWEYFSSPDDEKKFIGGTSIEELKTDFGLNQGDIEIYMPPNPSDLERAKIEVHYLGYYLRWHPQSIYYYCMENGGFKPSPERTTGTYSKYSSIDDKIDDFHYYTTYIKFGLGRATYDASQEVREGDLDREEGLALVKKYDGEWPERFSEEIFNYLSITEEEFGEVSKNFERPDMDKDYFNQITDSFRSSNIWKYEDSRWVLRTKPY